MRRILPGTIIVLLLLGTAALSAKPQTEADREANLKSFDVVWQRIKDRHWDPTLGGLDWEAVKQELRPRMEKVASKQEARALLREMLGRLKQSHFDVFPTDAYEERDSAIGEAGRDGTAGIHARVLGGVPLVTRVEEGSAAEKLGVRPGWEILRIQGQDLAPRLAALRQQHASSTLLEYTLAWAIMLPLSGKVGDTVTVQFRDGQDQLRDLEITFGQRSGEKFQPAGLPPRYVQFERRWLGTDIGYLRFNTWIDPARLTKEFSAALDEFRSARGIIIDLRGARGGLGALTGSFAGWFLQQPGATLGTMILRPGKAPIAVKPQGLVHAGELAILVDGLTRSAGEIFTGGLQDLERARVFGSRTAGAVLPSVIEKLPNGDSFQYAIADYVSNKGRRLEGAGVLPDVEIIPTRAQLLAGTDPVLDAAAAWIRPKK